VTALDVMENAHEAEMLLLRSDRTAEASDLSEEVMAYQRAHVAELAASDMPARGIGPYGPRRDALQHPA
jgi:hypothetical protein